MHIFITVWVILAAWRWGDWRRFSEFHATMLYMPGMNLLYLVLAYQHSLWTIESEFGIPDSIVIIVYSLIIFPFTVLLFLSNYPETIRKQIWHIVKWIVIYIGVEWIGHSWERITYDHGWHMGWSFLFLIVMFPMLRLHYKKPLIAYMLSVLIIAMLMYMFNVPWHNPAG